MAKNNKMPVIRFSGYTNVWEQYKLSDITEVIMGQSPSSKNYTDNPNDDILVQGNADLKDGKVVPRLWTKEITKTIDKGGIILTVRAPVGDVAKTDYKVVLGRGVAGIKGNDYIYQFLQKLQYNRYWVSLSSGLTFESINSNDIKDLIIDIPSIEEQTKISMLLNNVNSIITLHQRKLEKLKLTKKALLQKLFPQNGSKLPELRFKGFTDAWEQCKLGEIFEYLQNNTLSRDSLNYKNPNIKNIHYGDILVKFDEILDGFNKDIPYINSELDLSKFSKSLLRDGDIIFSDTAEDDTVGKAIELQNVNAPFILGGLHTIPCRPLIPFGKGYLGNFLNSDSYRLQLRPLIQGIKVSSISKSALKDTMIEYPKNLDEQEKIGSLFYYIAKMITLHHRKLEMLKNVKKGLLQKMFV